MDEDGNILVQKGESVTFTATPDSGSYINERTFSALHPDSAEVLDNASTSDVISYTYRYKPTESVEIVGTATPFRPFADLTPLKQTLLPDEEITVRLKIFDGMIRQIRSRAMRSSRSTKQKVTLQYFDPELEWVNSRYTFDIDSLAQCTFRNPSRLPSDGSAERYRFAILIDGKEYTSDEFKVVRTVNREDVSRSVAQEVDVYVRNGGISYSKDGGNWVRFDKVHPYLLMNPENGILYASKYKDTDVAVCAVFRAGTGTMELYGDSAPNADVKIGIVAIRTPAGTTGDLKLRLLGNVWLDMDHDTYSYFDEFGTGSYVNDREGLCAETSAITNMGGGVSIQAEKEYRLSIFLRGTESYHNDHPIATGLELAGIRAAGGVKVGGMARLEIGGEAYTAAQGTRAAIAFTGIVSDDTVVVTDSARMDISFNNQGRGGAQGLRAAGDVLLEKNSDTHIEISAERMTNALSNCLLYSAIEAQNVSMTGSAGLTVSASGDLLYGIRAESVSVNTDSDLLIRVPGKLSQPNAACCSYAIYAETTELLGCSSLSLGYREVTDPEYGGAVSGALTYDENSLVCYVTSNADTDTASESLWLSGQVYHVGVTLPDGAEDSFEYQIKAADKTLAEGTKAAQLSVCKGNRVQLTAPQARTGYTFVGWTVVGAKPADWEEAGRTVRFSMPGEDVSLVPLYQNTLFTSKPSFAVNKDDPQSGKLSWSAAENGSEVLYYSLQGMSPDGSWSDYYDDLRFSSLYEPWTLNETAEYVYDETGGLRRVFGTAPLSVNYFGGTGYYIDTFYNVIRFRICAHCGESGAGDYLIFSEEFTLDGLGSGESYGVWVGGVPVSSVNCEDVLGDSTVSYEPNSQTLTLNNAQLHDLYCRYWKTDDLYAAYGIFSEHDLRPRLTGSSEIRPGPSSAAYDFRSIPALAEEAYDYSTLDVIGLGTENGSITVFGSGRLDILSEEYGVVCEGDFTMGSGTLSIRAEDNIAISVWNGSFGMNVGSLTVDTGYSYGISLDHSTGTNRTVSFRDGEASISTQAAGIWLAGDNDTIRFSGGTLQLSCTDAADSSYALDQSVEFNRSSTLVEVAGSDQTLRDWDEATPLTDYKTVRFTGKAQSVTQTGKRVGNDSILVLVDGTEPVQTEYRVMLAEYDRKGKMVSVQVKELTVGEQTVEAQFQVSQNGYLWKCMLIDEATTPVCAALLLK